MMNILMIILCAVSITYSVFLIARFGIKRKDNSESVFMGLDEDK